MKQVTRAVLFLALFASFAMVARADTTSSGLSDFKVILNDPSCPSGTLCVDLGYDGNQTLNGVIFWAPSPTPIPVGQIAACGSNFFTNCQVFFPGDGDGNWDDFFYGVAYWGGTITPGEDLTIGVAGLSNFALTLPNGFECDNNACPNGIINFTPEPPTALLLLSGLLLFGILRRKFPQIAAVART